MKHDGTLHDGTLHETARRLGQSAAERLDVQATARRVLERLREQPARRTVWIPATWLRVAAAVVILVGGVILASRLTPGRRPGVSPGHTAHFVADDLHDLSTDELQSVLASFDDLLAGDTVAVPESNTDLRELDAQQLRQVLRSLEG